MNQVESLPCEVCDEAYPPSVYARHIDTTPSGVDLFGVFVCPNCSAQYAISFDREAFMDWFNSEQIAEAQAEADEGIKEHQRWLSAIGREVADFRRTLDATVTVEEMWAK